MKIINKIEKLFLKKEKSHPNIIWCNDCKHCRIDGDGWRYCEESICINGVRPDGFCGKAERETDE